MVSGVGPNSSMNLGKLMKAAGLDKGFAIANEPKIKLSEAEEAKLTAHVGTLQGPEHKAALDLLGYFKDRFELKSGNNFLDVLSKSTPAKPEAGGRTRSVAEANAERLGGPTTASVQDVNGAAESIDHAKAVGGDNVAGAMKDGMRGAVENGDVNVNREDGGRKAYVNTMAQNDSMAGIDAMLASPFFEDRLMAFLTKAANRFMGQLNEAMEKFDDPKREQEIRDAFKTAMKKGMSMADRLSPAGKEKAAARLADLLKQNPTLGGEGADVVKQWVATIKPQSGAGAAGIDKDAVLKAMPSSDNKIIEAMSKSDKAEIREMAGVFKATESAKSFAGITEDELSKMSPEQLRGVHGKMNRFSDELKGLRSMLPDDLQKAFEDVRIPEMPGEIDPTSRQMMFQRINMMTQQYQQIMQALNEIMGKMNEMAMDSVRKIGR
jgi:hypothetical protein